MDALRKLVGKGDNTPEPPLLSELVKIKHYLSSHDIGLYRDYAKSLKGHELTPAQKAWLEDYAENIVEVVRQDALLDKQVETRASGSRERSSSVQTFVDANQNQLQNQEQEAAATADAAASQGGPVRPKNLQRPLPLPPIKLNELVQKPDIFKGARKDARRWVDDFEAASAANGWLEGHMVKYFPAFLREAARDWYVSMAQPKLGSYVTWPEVRAKFLHHYLGRSEMATVREELRLAKQGYAEPATIFIPRIMRLFRMADPFTSEKDQVDEIRNRMREEYRTHLIGLRISTMDMLVEICAEIEASLASDEACRQRSNKFQSSKNSSAGNNKNNDAKGKTEPNKQSGNSRKPRSGEKQGQGKNEKLKYHCTHCNKDGHSVERCWEKHGKPASNRSNKQSNRSAAVDDSGKLQDQLTVKNVCSVVASSVERADSNINHPVELNGKRFSAMFDSGSRLSLMLE